MTTLSAQELTDILRRAGHLFDTEVVRVEKGQCFAAAADEVCRLHLTYSGAPEEAGPQTLICKRCSRDWYVKQGAPELTFYRHIATEMPQIPIVKLWGSVDDPGAQTSLVLLEDLNAEYQLAQSPLSQTQLELVTDVLVRLHAQWWEHPRLVSPHFLTPDESVCRMPQALAHAEIEKNFAAAAAATQRFLQNHAHELAPDEQTLLAKLSQQWGERFARRVADGKAITLIHGDFHLLGNIFWAKQLTTQPPLKIIDWAQSKRAIGVHDLMYMLLGIEADRRVERDLPLLRRYHAGLCQAGILDYSWEQCLWDYQFSQLTNLFQSLFQDSLHWFRKTFTVIQAWQSERLLSQESEVISH